MCGLPGAVHTIRGFRVSSTVDSRAGTGTVQNRDVWRLLFQVVARNDRWNHGVMQLLRPESLVPEQSKRVDVAS